MSEILLASGALFHVDADGGLFMPFDNDAEALLTYGPQFPVDGFEVLITRRMSERLDATRAVLERFAGPTPVVHAPKRLGSRLPDDDAVALLGASAAFAAAIGAGTRVLHLWDLPDADVDMQGRLRAAKLAADVVAECGVTCAIESIPCRVHTPLANLQRALEVDDRLAITLDTEFLAMHDELDDAMDADWLWPRVHHVHLKDFDGRPSLNGRRRYLLPGTGHLDFARVFDTLRERRYERTVALEATAHTADGRPDVPGLSACLARMAHSPWRFA